ncbi:hypothetical protein V6N13_014966 [Hibiscus sabdariffa]
MVDQDFWFDRWIHGVGPLANHVAIANRCRLPKLPMAAMGPSPLFPDDEVGWGLRSDLQFTIKSAYEVHCGDVGGDYESIWTILHSFRGLPKIKMFMWHVIPALKMSTTYCANVAQQFRFGRF